MGTGPIEAALQSLDNALQQSDDARSAIAQAAHALRSLVQENCVPDNVIRARLQRILDALKKYGGRTYLQIYGDGSLTVNTEALDGFWQIIANYPNIKALLAADPAEWMTVDAVNGAWSAHKPTPRAGDYRFPQTWMFGSTRGIKLHPEKEVDMNSYRDVFDRGYHDRLEQLSPDDNPYPEASPACVWWALGWQSADGDVARARKMGLTPAYWDCACATDYIHPHTADHCPRCNARQIDRPWARLAEVEVVYD